MTPEALADGRLHARMREWLRPWQGAGRNVPGVVLGAGPSLPAHLPWLRQASSEGWCLVVAVPAALEALHEAGGHATATIGSGHERQTMAEALQARAVPTAFLAPEEAGLPSSVWAWLLLRALDCQPMVLAGLDLACTDGLVHGAGHEVDRDWAPELNPFRTMEDLHLASLRHDAIPREIRDRSGRTILSTQALELERQLLETAISVDAAAGIAVLDVDPRGPVKRGSQAMAPAAAVPRRGEVTVPAWPLPRGVDGVVALDDGADPAAAPVRVDVRHRARVAAVVAVDPETGGTGAPRHVDSELAGRPVLWWVIERLRRVRGLERVIVLAPDAAQVASLLPPSTEGTPVEVEATQGSPFPPEQVAIRTARLWADSAWRGGIGGAAAHDEIVAPAATLRALRARGLDAALLCGPDWPLVTVEGRGGANDLVARWREADGALDPVFAPGPPGLASCVVGCHTLEWLAARSGPGTLGALYVSLPRPERDRRCVRPPPRIRRSLVRAVFDTARGKLRMRRGLEPIVLAGQEGDLSRLDAMDAVTALEQQAFHLPPAFVAQHLVVEINTGRRASGLVSPHRWGSIQRPPMSRRLLDRVLEEVEAPRDVVVTLGHVGDPLWHPELPDFIRACRAAGVRGVHVRTELLADRARIDAMMAAAPDVISVDLHGESRATSRALMGIDALPVALANMEYLQQHRQRLSAGGPAFQRPLLVARLQRREQSAHELASFVDLWQRVAGWAVIEPPPPGPEEVAGGADPLLPAGMPTPARWREGLRRMVILSDGRVPASELDLRGDRAAASVARGGVFDAWRDLVVRRRQVAREEDVLHPELALWQP